MSILPAPPDEPTSRTLASCSFPFLASLESQKLGKIQKSRREKSVEVERDDASGEDG